MVGDVDPAKVADAIASTFGALPTRPAPVLATVNPVRFPPASSGTIVRLHKGRADQAVAIVGWPTLDFFSNTREARALGVLQDVLENRLIDQVRVAEGSTYSPSGDSRPSEVYPCLLYTSPSPRD